MESNPPQNSFLVIMAGGSGERFWPVSSPEVPKQLLRIHEGRSLLDMAFERAVRIVAKDRIFVVAGPHLAPAIRRELPDLLSENLIEEPAPRNTAACLGLAASVASIRFPGDAVMGVLTADHLIDDVDGFRRSVTTALHYAARSDDLVTIGIAPRDPETAFGYLEVGDRIDSGQDGMEIFRVSRFTEKPDLETARRFLEQGNYFWNSGMFFWNVSALLNAFKAFQPAMFTVWQDLIFRGESGIAVSEFVQAFEALPSLPIDTAIMERATNVAAVKGTFPWEDVGSWNALDRAREGDAAGNRTFGSARVVQAQRNIVYNEGDPDQPGQVVLFGVDDLVVVRTKDTVLVMPKDRSQDVKALLRELKGE